MLHAQASQLVNVLRNKGISFDDGLTNDEVIAIERKFDVQFPSDLKLLLQIALPVSESFVNWRLGLVSKTGEAKIKSMLSWPWEGLLFDIETNFFWWPAWGSKPAEYEAQVLIAHKHYRTYPKLIPIYSHRFIPSKPNGQGNPVFSVYQMDVIYYGFDLATYPAHEFNFKLPDGFEIPEQPNVSIEFWSEIVN